MQGLSWRPQDSAHRDRYAAGPHAGSNEPFAGSGAMDENVGPPPPRRGGLHHRLFHRVVGRHRHHHHWEHVVTFLKSSLYLLAGLVVIIWTIFALGWSSWGYLYWNVPNLRALVLNLDSPSPLLPTVAAGATVASSLLASNLNTTEGTGQNQARMWLGWEQVGGPGWSAQMLQDAVLKEEAWAAVLIQPGTSAALVDALNGADNGYDPAQAIQFYYSEARSVQAAQQFVVPLTQELLLKASQQLSSQFASAWLTNLSRSTNTAGIATSLTTVNTGLLTAGVGYTVNNLHPANQSLGMVLSFFSIVYLIVLCLPIHLIQNAILGPLRDRLSTWVYFSARIGMLVLYYFIISAFIVMLCLAFGVDFSLHFGKAGPALYWVLVFLGLCAFGLAIEAAANVMPATFVPIFLFLWLVSNVSVLVIPFDLQPRLFRYAYAWPSYNVARGAQTIVFGIRNTLGVNYGVLVGWTVLNLVTNAVGVMLETWWGRRKDKRAYDREKESFR